MSEHTPTPWNAETPYGEPGIWIASPNSALVASLRGSCGDFDNAPANGAFIVRACNAHDGLVEALEDAAERLMWNGDDPKETLQGYIMDAHDRIRAALALAKGE